MNKYMDAHYNFKGLWDVPSMCGLKIVKTNDRTIVIATDLYEENPGTSVTNFCAKLATIILKENDLDHDKMIFIECTPDNESKLTFNHESFVRIEFDWEGNKFVCPRFHEITKDEVDALIGS
ncbi:hypothetical protein ACFL2A_06235 [Thermodesulfobacteriota bacterium]